MNTQKAVIPQSQTTIQTWFERDRAHVALVDKETEQTTYIEWWDEAVSEAVEDGFLSAKDWHGTAYQYAKDLGVLPVVPKHYIVVAGMKGCLPNYCGSCQTYKDAVADLADMHELGRTRTAMLRKRAYLDLNLERDGNEYCEITVCHCDDPDSHNDN